MILLENVHDVGLVNSSDLCSLVINGILKGIVGNTLGCLVGDNLDGLSHSFDRLHHKINENNQNLPKIKRQKRKKHTEFSIPEYSPSVFSRITTVSTSEYLVLKPGMERQGRTLAYKLNAFLKAKLSDM